MEPVLNAHRVFPDACPPEKALSSAYGGWTIRFLKGSRCGKGYKAMNADLNARVVLDSEAMAWRATDVARGVCMQLDRVDAESAQTTSVVQNTPKKILELARQGL